MYFLSLGRKAVTWCWKSAFVFIVSTVKKTNEERVGMINTLNLDQKFTAGKVLYLDSNWMLMKILNPDKAACCSVAEYKMIIYNHFSIKKHLSTKDLKVMNKCHFLGENSQFSQKVKTFGPKQCLPDKTVSSYDVHSLYQREKYFLISFVDPIIPGFLE